MFLFTTADARESTKPASVVDAIRDGARQTGTGFDYLVRTAQKESALDPNAKAKTSSATGLFQFIDQTWLGLIKTEGDKYGLGRYAGVIAERNGVYAVDDPRLRTEILGLRHDPKVSSVMAGVLAQKNRETLVATLGREPNAADLYVAHVLGANGAQTLIRTSRRTPTQAAAPDFPDAAAANRAIFFDRAGRARGAAEVYAILSADHASVATPPIANASRRAAASVVPSHGSSDAPALDGLFRTQARPGPISEAVTRLWTTGARRQPVLAESRVIAFYPRSTPSEEAATLADEAPADAPQLVHVPLPPMRPPGLGGVQELATLDVSSAKGRQGP